jgi:hypothetical protein
MHYGNGRKAVEGDAVVAHDGNGKVFAGTLHSIQPAATSCNARVATPVPGGVDQNYVTLSNCYHANDAWNCMKERSGS